MLSEVQKSNMHIPGWLKKYEKYFPAGYTQDEMKNVIENLLKKWCKGELKYEKRERMEGYKMRRQNCFSHSNCHR